MLVHRELQNRPSARMSIYGYSLKYRLTVIVGSAFVLIAFMHVPWTIRLVLGILVLVFLMNSKRLRQRSTGSPAEPRAVVEPQAKTAEEDRHSAASEPLDAEVVPVSSDATNRADTNQITASYAHPSTGMAHTDAALQVYMSSEEGPAKARARRVIIAGLTKTTAFRTGDEDLNEALRHIVKTNDPDALKDKLQVMSGRLAGLVETEAECFDDIRQKVLTVLTIAQIIAENSDKQSLVQATEFQLRTMELERPSTPTPEPGAQNDDNVADSETESGDPPGFAGEKAFTLVELLVVIAVIGMLMGVGLCAQ